MRSLITSSLERCRKRLADWLDAPQAPDNLRCHLRTMQIILLLIAALVVYVEFEMLRLGIRRTWLTHSTNLAASLLALVSLALVRRGRFLSGTVLFSYGFMLILGGSTVLSGLKATSQSWIYSYFPLLLSGILLKPADTWRLALIQSLAVAGGMIYDASPFDEASMKALETSGVVRLVIQLAPIAVAAFAINNLGQNLRQALQASIQKRAMVEREFETLRSVLPICSHCRKIRNDAGAWDAMESYLLKHSNIFFSHSICPHCMKVHYAEFMDEPPEPPRTDGR